MERMCTNVRSLADTPDTHMQIHHETNVHSLTCRYTTRRMFALLHADTPRDECVTLHADTPRDDVRSLTCRYTTRRMCNLTCRYTTRRMCNLTCRYTTRRLRHNVIELFMHISLMFILNDELLKCNNHMNVNYSRISLQLISFQINGILLWE